MIGQKLGHYRVVAKIGAGGMGEVYQARDELLQRDVALKILLADSPGGAAAQRHLLREAQSASALNDPHICTIYEVGEANGRAFIAMEFVEGRPLNSLIPAEGLPAGLVVRYGAQIAAALAHAHDRGVIHRDVKTSNVVITPAGQVKVLDFGLAKRPSGSELEEATRSLAPATRPEAIVGTLPYMAPEILRGEEADARSDIWALGVALYEMATGGRPFRGQTGYELSSAILRESPAPLPQSVPPGLRVVIERCLEKERGQRYQRAGEAQAALEAVKPEPSATLPAAAVAAAVPPRRPPGWIVAAAAAALAIALGVAANLGGVRDRLFRASPAGRIQSIAVLPLENLSRDPEQQYFADGMTEELITDLAQLHALRVISRTSAMRYKGSPKSIPEIAKELSVDAVLEGSVERVGDRVRINAQLIYAPTDTHVWAEKYDRDLRDILALQGEVAQAISGEIQAQLDPSEREKLGRARQIKPEAYDAYSRGRFHLNLQTPKDTQTALKYFRQAIAEEPNYAEAYAGLADTYILLGEPYIGGLPPQESLSEAKKAATKAIELNDSLGEVHFSLAHVLEVQDWDWAGAEKEYKRALDLSPNNARVHEWYAEYLQALGRKDQAIDEIKRAIKLDPLAEDLQTDLGYVYYTARRMDDAFAQLKPLNDHRGLCWVYRERKQYQDAIAECEQEISQAGRLGLNLASLGNVYAWAGKRDAAQSLLEELKDRSKQQYISPYVIAYVEVGMGRKDQAFALLENAFKVHDQWMVWLKVDPSFDALRPDPRYQDLIRRVGFPP